MKLHKINVLPQIPPELSPLWEIAYNLWWSWNPIAIDLFRRMDPNLWSVCEHNPVALLGRIGSGRLAQLSDDSVFLAHMNRVSEELNRFRTETTWMQLNHPDWEGGPIAYFSMEYGFHESMPNYAGGLGILAGDHLKSASELGLPLLGVGLMYQQSHYHQHLTHDGWQKEVYQDNDFIRLPARLVKDSRNQPVTVKVEVAGKPAWLQAWELKAGHAIVYLLDANVEHNEPAQRQLTSQLYAPGLDLRLGQEIVLGIGGVRMLHAMGIHPVVFHMNEGHSAFLALERIRVLVKEQHLTVAEAVEAVRASTVFTTHTPVPAGIDRFERNSIAAQLAGELKEIGMGVDDLMRMGLHDADDTRHPLSMAILAIRTSAYRNGVSRLHGQVARQMWADLWPEVPIREVPIGHVTNGVHSSTWLADEMARLFDRYLGPQWSSEPLNAEVWDRIDLIPDNELWRAKVRLRERMVGFVRRRLEADLTRRGPQPGEVRAAQEVLDPDILTIGFARRFTSYKRATLFFRDPDQVMSLLTDRERPVQIVFAGKAHPADHEGKRFIQEIIHQCRRKEYRSRLVFIEDYEFNIARYLVQGVDVWLNNPRRPMEACGTSGMKVVLNGGLHLSVPDGWWDEAFDPDFGWAIGGGEQFEDPAQQDLIDSRALYNILREEVLPLYYERAEGLPRRWLRKMKDSLRGLVPVYNSNRMVKDYLDRYYLPAREGWERFSAEGFRIAREVAAWRERVTTAWPSVAFTSFNPPASEEIGMNEMVDVRCSLALGGLSPDEVRVEVCHGTLDSRGEIPEPRIEPLVYDKSSEGGDAVYVGAIRVEESGTYAFAVRATPAHPHLRSSFDAGLVTWA